MEEFFKILLPNNPYKQYQFHNYIAVVFDQEIHINAYVHQFANCLESKGHQYNTRDHTTEGTQNSEAQTNRQTARCAGTKHTKMCWTSTGSSTLSGVWGTHIALL